MLLAVILIALCLFLPKGYIFSIFSVAFWFIAATAEFIFSNQFYGVGAKKHPPENISILKNFYYGFLYIHFNMAFLKKYRQRSMYDFINSERFFRSTTPYFIMFLYTIIVFILYQCISYFAFIIYLIPIITNTFCFFSYWYAIVPKKKIK